MKERPILFSGPMVKAILEGRKTVTRRLWPTKIEPGDVLWVKETFGWGPFSEVLNRGEKVYYRADGENDLVDKWKPSIFMPSYLSRILLQVLSVREELLQKITEEDAIKEGIERLNAGRGFYDPTMGKEAAHSGHYFYTAKEAFRFLWDSLNAKRGYGWDKNPEVARIEFKVLEIKR